MTKLLCLYPSQYTKNYNFYVTFMCTWLCRSNYYGPMHWTRRDGIATAIQRGRDLGVPPLNTVLRHYSQPVMDWATWGSKTDPKVSLNSVHIYKLFRSWSVRAKQNFSLKEAYKVFSVTDNFFKFFNSQCLWGQFYPIESHLENQNSFNP